MGYKLSGIKVSKDRPLFPRIEPGKVGSSRFDFTKGGTGANLISPDDFAKVELKVGRVISAERVEKSNKLIKLQVDTGEIRQIVAGLGKTYSPDDLAGKKIVVVTNLQPAKLMGVESQGMLLAATDRKGILSILIPDKEIKEGAKIK